MKYRYKKISVNGRKMEEHRYVMEQHLGRYLETHEVVRRRNDDPKDNRIENLYVTNKRRMPHEQNAAGTLYKIKESEAKKAGMIAFKNQGKRVMLCSLNGEDLIIIGSIGLAAKIIGCSRGNVSDVLSGRKKQTHGFIIKQTT